MDGQSTEEGPLRLTHEAAVEAVRRLTDPALDTGPGPRPLVLIEAGRGYGKTSFLDRLAREAGEFLPYGRMDFASVRSPDFAAVLSDLAGQLARHRPRYGKLRFPRLLTGQFVAGWTNLDPARFDRLGRTIREQLRHDRTSPALLDGQEQPSPEASGPDLTIGLAAPTVTIPLSSLAAMGRRARPIGRGVRWYGDQDKGLRQRPEDVLADHYRKARALRTGDAQERNRARDEVNALLCAAFLADLRHTPGRVRRRLRTPLLLLDNVHSPVGRVFLRELLDARHQMVRQRSSVPLTLVLTCESNSLPELDRERFGPLSGLLAPRPARGRGRAGRGRTGGARASVSPWGVEGVPPVLRNRPPELTREEIDALHRGEDGRGDWRLARLIHAFSGGHPETGRLLCGMASARPGGWPSVAELLRDRVPEPPSGRPDTVAERVLLERLLPFEREVLDRAVEALAPLAAARTRDERHWVTGRAEFVQAEWRDTVRAAAAWDFEGDAGLRVLRQLLLGTLASRPSDDAAGWDAVHGELAHRGRLHDDQAGALHHELAVDRLGPVARELAAELGRRGARAWLETVDVVTEAPCGRRARRRMQPYERYVDLLRVLDEEEWWTRGEDSPAAHTAKLVAARRVVSDPLTGMDRRYLYEQMAGALTALAEVSRDGMVALNEAADRCRSEAELWAAP
ncbi:hypothetical protein GCM10009801_31610 [Streptomyces albiaxialis]|uniref:Orc1-like AAA ATPase domain-containing protein n=1 Tax=Streptomyces albiaxialis TaxID=329523 RepID=A0ABP5HN79_9ACTN